MKVSRRQILIASAFTTASFAFRKPLVASKLAAQSGASLDPPVFGIQPVLFDGKWNWSNIPPGQSGLLDPRDFDVKVGVRWQSTASASELKASTVAPVAHPEQQISEFEIVTRGGDCQARVQPLSEVAGQLQVVAPGIERGQTIEAIASYRLRISRVCHRYEKSQFPGKQVVPKSIAARALGNSPGIRCDLKTVAQVVSQVASRHDHPWDAARKFFDWTWQNIHGVAGQYTSVKTAMIQRRGDCEERAGVFIALCRAFGIPARLVWVPNHSWAEICLLDHAGAVHWIPCHTAAYNWFGWTGAHELTLQKGDRIRVPGPDRTLRLVNDWFSFKGRQPDIQFIGSMTPVHAAGKDPGPGKRIKSAPANGQQGGWVLDRTHPESKFVRE